MYFLHMLNSSLLGNKEHISKNLSFDCSICKLGKSKTLSFSSHGSRAENALILCIVMYRAFLLLFLMLDINIL
jgi:hypothetical protein